MLKKASCLPDCFWCWPFAPAKKKKARQASAGQEMMSVEVMEVEPRDIPPQF